MRLKAYLLLLNTGFIFLAACNSNAQHTNLSVTEFEKAIVQNNVQVLDVRTPGEYQSVHLKNAF